MCVDLCVSWHAHERERAHVFAFSKNVDHLSLLSMASSPTSLSVTQFSCADIPMFIMPATNTGCKNGGGRNTEDKRVCASLCLLSTYFSYPACLVKLMVKRERKLDRRKEGRKTASSWSILMYLLLFCGYLFTL